MRNIWGDAPPYAIQHLLGRAAWNADNARDATLRYAKEHLLAPGEGGVLIVSVNILGRPG